MRVTDYTVRSISVDEVQQLLGENTRSVFLLLFPSEQAVKPEMECEALDPAASGAALAIPGDGGTRDQMLADYLHQLGVPTHIRGYEYIKKAVEFAMEDPTILGAMTKELYPDIAKSCGGTARSVERAIRHAIETAWNRGSIPLQDDMFGTTMNSIKGRPTNGEFIATIVEKLRLRQM